MGAAIYTPRRAGGKLNVRAYTRAPGGQTVRDAVSFPQIEAILEILDDHDITREKIEIPLGCKDPGGLEPIARGKIRVTVPESGDFDQWLEGIAPKLLEALGWEG